MRSLQTVNRIVIELTKNGSDEIDVSADHVDNKFWIAGLSDNIKIELRLLDYIEWIL